MRAFFLAPLALAALTGCGFVTGSAVGVLFSQDGDLGLDNPSTTVGGFWAGTGVVCLHSDDAVAVADAGLYELHGRVVSDETTEVGADFGNLVPCDGDPGRVLTLRTTSGETYQLGYAWRDPYGYDMTPWPSFGEGDTLDVVVRQGASEGTLSAGMAISEGSGKLLYALEAGRGEPGLVDGDIADLTVRADREITRSADESCGERVTLALDFTSSDGTLSLMEGEDNAMVVDDEYFTTCSISSHEIEQCDENVGEVSWVMFR